jgi:hypothetical protein
MPEREQDERKKKGVSKTGLILGATGLFLFIVGVKKTFQVNDEPPPAPEPPPPPPPAPRKRAPRRKKAAEE